MFGKIKDLAKKFFKEVGSDLKKIKISSIFTDLRFLAIFMFSLAVMFILLLNMNFFALLKGFICLIIFYFVFLWRK